MTSTKKMKKSSEDSLFLISLSFDHRIFDIWCLHFPVSDRTPARGASLFAFSVVSLPFSNQQD